MIRSSPELAAIVERWITAYGKGDGDTMTNLLSSEPALSYIGSADNENWRDDALRRGIASYINEVPRFEWDPLDLRGYVEIQSMRKWIWQR